MRKLTDSSQVDEARKLMKMKPMVIFFYMEGCPHCEATKPAWDSLSSLGLPFEFAEIETAAVPPESGIHGFPHFSVKHQTGRSKVSDGKKSTAKELADSLGITLSKPAPLRRLRRTRSGGLRRRIRKRTQRTLRRNKSL